MKPWHKHRVQPLIYFPFEAEAADMDSFEPLKRCPGAFEDGCDALIEPSRALCGYCRGRRKAQGERLREVGVKPPNKLARELDERRRQRKQRDRRRAA